MPFGVFLMKIISKNKPKIASLKEQKKEHAKFIFLLVSLGILILVYPFLTGNNLESVLLNFIFTIIIFAATYLVSANKKTLFIAIALGLPWLIASWMHLFIHQNLLTVIVHIFAILFYTFIIITILLHILRAYEVTIDIIYGAISLYLLIAVTFAVIYSFAEFLQPNSFYIPAENNINNIIDWSDFIYFSFQSLTSASYGDITPIKPLTRILSNMESVLGIFFIAILIARLVGSYNLNNKK